MLTERACFQRVQRRLARDQERLKKSRPGKWQSTLGEYYVVDVRNVITAQYVNIWRWALDLGVLTPAERAWLEGELRRKS